MKRVVVDGFRRSRGVEGGGLNIEPCQTFSTRSALTDCDELAADNQRAAASALSSGMVLNAIEVLGAVLCTVFTQGLKQKKVFGRKANSGPDDNAIVCRGAQPPLHSWTCCCVGLDQARVGLPSTVSYLLQALLNSSLNILCIHTWWQSGIGIVPPLRAVGPPAILASCHFSSDHPV